MAAFFNRIGRFLPLTAGRKRLKAGIYQFKSASSAWAESYPQVTLG
jgi:hypothetical protein